MLARREERTGKSTREGAQKVRRSEEGGHESEAEAVAMQKTGVLFPRFFLVRGRAVAIL